MSFTFDLPMNFPTGCTHDSLAAAMYRTSSSKYLPEANAIHAFHQFVQEFIDKHYHRDINDTEQLSNWYEYSVESVENMGKTRA